MNITDFHFIRPYWFIALLPVALLIALSVRNKLARGNWSEVCDAALLPFILQDNDKKAGRRWSSNAFSIASIIAIIALAGPTWEKLPTPVFKNDAAVVIALDLSQSMNASDIKPSRLVRARYKIADILSQRQDGLTALIAYAGDAFTVTPLTEDNATISSQINALETSIMPSQGNNTLAAIKQSVELLKQAGQSQGGILLITDEVSQQALKKAKSVLGNYKLSILGVGTNQGAPIKLPNGGFLKDKNGSIVIPKLNRSQLTALANAGGGIYQEITPDESDISRILAHTAHAVADNASKDDNKNIEQWAEMGPWLLLVLLPLAALYFRKGLLIVPLVLVMNYPQDSYAFGWQDLWQTQDQQAQSAFDKQQYDEAAKKFTSPERQAAAQYKAKQYQQAAETLGHVEQKTANDLYNKATSLAKAGQLEQALKTYDEALKLDPKLEDAIYNKKIIEDELKKQQQKNKDQKSQQGDKNQQQKDKDKKKPNSSDKNQDKNKGNKPPSDKEQQDKNKQKPADQNKDADNKQQKDKQNQQSEQEKKEQAEKDKKQQQQKAQAEKDKKQAKDEQKPSQAKQAQQGNDEEKQAQEQWLKRIPDDPSGLLKRKFKYQYNQRNQGSQQEQTW